MTPEVEDALIAQLENLGLFRAVKSVADISAQNVSAQITPAAYVGFDGYRVTKTSSDGTGATLDETWAVVVVVKSAKQGDGGKDGRENGLSLARSALKSLSGLVPIPAEPYRVMTPVTPSQQPVWDAGFLWVPIAFTHQTTINAKE